MAIVVLVLWLFTAGVGVYLLVTSDLGRARPAATAQAAEPPAASVTAAVQAEPAAQAAPIQAAPAQAAPAQAAAPAAQAAPAQAAAPAAQAAPAQAASKREMRRAARNRFDPPSLTAAKKAPVVPELRSLLEFAHPASGLIGFGFWLGYTFVHYRALGWIAFGLVTVTVCLGLTWFTANTRAARHRPADEPGPSFSTRLVVLHGGAATVTFALAFLSALVLGR
jgi:nucleoid-associated protein YgaU